MKTLKEREVDAYLAGDTALADKLNKGALVEVKLMQMHVTFEDYSFFPASVAAEVKQLENLLEDLEND
jgi:predicted component of type VI protein secretion system